MAIFYKPEDMSSIPEKQLDQINNALYMHYGDDPECLIYHIVVYNKDERTPFIDWWLTLNDTHYFRLYPHEESVVCILGIVLV